MVNHKKKAGKKTKTVSNTTKKEKRTVPSTPPSVVSDHDRIPVVTSLPPAVDGHLRCFLRVSVPTIHWLIHKYPTDVQVRLKWWGEDGDGVLLRPVDDKAGEQTRDYPRLTCVRYAVCSGPRQFDSYLNDMRALIFEVVHGPSLIVLGQVRLVDVSQLSASTPIQGFFDVISTTSPGEKLALLYIALRFESTSAAYSQLSSSLIPTVDMEIDPQRQAVDESDAKPTPPPSFLNPTEPTLHPRQSTPDVDLFVSPAVHAKGVKFAVSSPERLEYTAEHSLFSTPRTDKEEMETNVAQKIDETPSTVRSELTSMSSPLHKHRGDNLSSDLIGALLQRGEKLREAMVMSADEDNDGDEPGGMSSIVERNSPPGKLFKAILTSDEKKYGLDKSGVDEDAAIQSVFLHNNKAVDLLLGEEEKHYLEESPDSSPESSIVSEPGDPLYDDTLLKDLFYTTPAVQSDTESDNTVITDEEDDGDDIDHNNSMQNPSQREKFKKVLVKTGRKKQSPQIVSRDISTRTGKEVNLVEQPGGTDDLTKVSSMGYLDPKQSSTDHTSQDSRDQDSVHHNSSGSFTSTTKDKLPSLDPHDFIESLGPEKLTALGRVDAARVMVDSLGITNENIRPGTYLVEYNFPTSTPAHGQDKDISMATELTRIASKKLQDRVVLFNHRSVFPVLFNSAVIDYWWRLPLTFRLYFRESGQRKPVVIGVATFPLKTVLQSDTLSSSASLQIKCDFPYKHGESSSSSSLYNSSGSCGPLLVKVELMTDGKQLHVKPNMHRKPPLPTATAPTATTEHMQVARPAYPVTKNLGGAYDMAPHRTTEIVNPSSRHSPQDNNLDVGLQHDRDPLTLYNLLWIPEGKALTQHGFHTNQDAPSGLVIRSNLYLVCRTFWCEEVSKSRVCWGESNPSFGFKQVAPVLLTLTLLQRVCNNFMVIEVWNRIGPHDQGDKLVGLVKLPLHQLYLSYRDPKITRTLLKSKYPVMAVDEWCPVTNPFTHTQHGQLRVVLAMGSEEQIGAILSVKCGGEVPVGMESRPDHHLDLKRMRDEKQGEGVHVSSNQELVEHQFEIVVEDIRGLSMFGSTVWGETDCFVQYHFPFQSHLEPDYTLSDGIPHLQPHRTPTTLCVPDPAFHDVARHTFKLPCGVPAQKHLLAAFTGSMVAVRSVPGSGGVPFELWRRYYYPNIRDQMVAKASLPLAKLCAMVTMQKQGEANIQTFSLPLTVLAGDEVDGTRQDRVQDTGLLDVFVKYQQVKVGQQPVVQKEVDNHVCLSLEVFQACGLKAAAVLHAKSNPSLSYPAEVGVNAYIVIQFPLGKKHKHVTRTVARTFSPEFSYNADILLPVVVPSVVSDRGNLSLAEQLEESEMVFEVWHQMSRGMSGDQMVRGGAETKSGVQRDVLLGVGRVPLIKLLAQKTGVKGWFPIHLPGEHDTHDATPHDEINKVVGGLELSIAFSEAEDRDHVLHLSRGLGWSPPPEIDCDEVCLDREDLSKNKHWAFCMKINTAWIPSSELVSFNASAKNADKRVKGYARYKLYNKAPICSRVSSVKDSGDGNFICELKHSKDIVLPTPPSLTWHMREECLEIQLWLSNRGQTTDRNSKKRDRLVGSAYVDVSSLLAGKQRKHRQISGLYPLFRSGASNLFGGCIHVQAFVNLCPDDTSDHELLSSDESVGGSSPVEDHTADSRMIISSQDHMPSVEPTHKHKTSRQLPIIEADDESFLAHVIIEQALHLPTVPEDSDTRIIPNVYVSYQTLSSKPPTSTPVVMCSSNPSWEYQKLERLSYTSLKSQALVFKVWHTSGAQKGLDNRVPESSEHRVDSSSDDHLIGFVSFDLSPLLAGMRQLIGWYNVTNFNGDCQGQIKLGVSPVKPLSPPRCLTASRLTHSCLPKQDATFIIPLLNSHAADGSDHQIQVDNPLSGQQQGHSDYSSGVRQHSHGSFRLKTDGEAEALSSCSLSLLFSQLRHNMKELDILQQNLNVKLRCSTAKGDDGHTQEDSFAISRPCPPLSGIDATARTHLGPLRTLRSENTTVEGHQLEDKSVGAEFKETGHIHELLNGKEMMVVINDGYKLSSPISPLEMEQAGSFADCERTIDDMLDKGATTSNCKEDSFSEKCKEESLKHTQWSVVEDRRPSVNSELSLTDISGDLSVSGYVQDNTKDTRFADLKDSWLSSEEEENTNMRSKKPGLLNAPPGLNADRDTEIQNITGTTFHEVGNHTSDHEVDFSDIDDDNDEEQKDVHVMQSEVDRRQSLDDSPGSHDSVEDLTGITIGSVNGITAMGNSIFSESDHKKEPNSKTHSSNSLNSRELPKQDSLRRYPASYQQTSATLPNFFMPSEQLEESMRALRLGSSTTSSHSKLLARSKHLRSKQQAKDNLTEKFSKRQPLYKARKDERPPISNSEVDRIARIFNFNSGSS